MTERVEYPFDPDEYTRTMAAGEPEAHFHPRDEHATTHSEPTISRRSVSLTPDELMARQAVMGRLERRNRGLDY
jgi:hypothetical protein